MGSGAAGSAIDEPPPAQGARGRPDGTAPRPGRDGGRIAIARPACTLRARARRASVAVSTNQRPLSACTSAHAGSTSRAPPRSATLRSARMRTGKRRARCTIERASRRLLHGPERPAPGSGGADGRASCRARGGVFARARRRKPDPKPIAWVVRACLDGDVTPVLAKLREAIIRARAERLSYDQIASMLGVGHATVNRILRLHRETKNGRAPSARGTTSRSGVARLGFSRRTSRSLPWSEAAPRTARGAAASARS